MRIQNIIFDWDGTLARTLDLWLFGYKASLERQNFKFEAKEIVAEFFHNHRDVADRHPNLNFPVVVAETRDHVLQASSTVHLYDGAIETLAALKDNQIPLSLVSSSSRRLLENGMGAHDLESFFSSVVAGDDGYGYKPDTLPFEETLNRMGANAGETLVIGDSHVDILAGKALGCQTCLFAPPQNDLFYDFEHLKSLEPDHEIHSLLDLTQHL